MKTLFLCLAFLLVVSCRDRNPNLSEKQLLALMNDTTQKVAESPVSVFPDTSYVPPVGAKYPEIRSVDPAHPPITLKVSTSAGAKQSLKLSMFGASVEYVTLQLPDENDFFLSTTRIQQNYERGMGLYSSNTQVNMLGDHFITSDQLGIRLFNPTGKFVQNLLMSEFEGKRNIQQIEINMEGYKQAGLGDISGTRCLLWMGDYTSRKRWIGEFDLANMPLYVPHPELRHSAPGIEMVPVRNAPGRKIDNNTQFSLWGGRNLIAVTFNNMGDTLTKFTNHVRLEEGQTGGPANSDRSFSYSSDGELFFRQAYCDTIFRVQSANRIVPVYRFDFGAQRASLFEGTTSRTQGKLIPWKLLDFKNSMLLIFTEGRDCPACRTADAVTFHCLLFDKRTGHPTAIDMRSRYPENALIENDIDGGLPIPLNSLRREGDVIIATFTKGQIEEILKNNAGNIPSETVSKLKSLANALKKNEMLVMVVREKK